MAIGEGEITAVIMATSGQFPKVQDARQLLNFLEEHHPQGKRGLHRLPTSSS
jgi:hypothetical protein